MSRDERAHVLLAAAVAGAAVLLALAVPVRQRHAKVDEAIGEIVGGYEPGAGGDVSWSGRFGPGYGCPFGDMHSVVTARHPLYRSPVTPRADITRLIAVGWLDWMAHPPAEPETELAGE